MLRRAQARRLLSTELNWLKLMSRLCNLLEHEILEYDSFSVEPIIWVRRGHESESGQMVLKKVKLTYFDAYLWQTMWNHAKKSMEESKHSDSVFLQWDCAENAKKTQKLEKLKRKLLKILKRYDLSRVAPCESWRPEVSENVVVFEDWSF